MNLTPLSADVPQTRSRGNVFELRARQTARGIRITPKTAQSLWTGEKMDDGMALDGLLRLE